MKVLVTGCSGFLGPSLVASLRSRGHEVGGTYLGARPELPGTEVCEVDITDEEAVRRAVGAIEPDVIVHLAGFSHVGSSWESPELCERVNAAGTAHVVAAAAGARIVLASSAEVYGVVPEAEQPIPESRPVAPASPYGLSKARAESLVLDAGGTVVRSFNVVGPGQARTFAMPAFACQLLAIRRGESEPHLEVGNLEPRRDFVHLHDAVEGFALLSELGISGSVYNLGTGRAYSIREAVDRLIDLAGVEVEVRVDPARFRPVDAELLVADSSRLRGLGWEPKRSLRGALRDLLDSLAC